MKKISTIQFLIGEPNSNIFKFCRKIFEPKNIIISSLMNLENVKHSPKSVKPDSIKENVYNSFWDLEFKLDSKIYDCNDINTLFNDINNKNVDVLVTNYSLKDSCVYDILKKIIRKTKTSVFIYPNDSGYIKSINVGVNLRKKYNKYIDSSYNIANKLNIDTVNLINVYEIPDGYYKTGKTFDEYSKKMELNISSKFDNFLKKYKKNKHYFNTKLIKSRNLPKSLSKNSDKNTLLVIGDKYKNELASMVLGNNSEEILYNTDNPVFLERSNEDDNNFLKSLMGLE